MGSFVYILDNRGGRNTDSDIGHEMFLDCKLENSSDSGAVFLHSEGATIPFAVARHFSGLVQGTLTEQKYDTKMYPSC